MCGDPYDSTPYRSCARAFNTDLAGASCANGHGALGQPVKRLATEKLLRDLALEGVGVSLRVTPGCPSSASPQLQCHPSKSQHERADFPET